MLVQDHRLPVRRCCQIVRLSRAAYYRPPMSRARQDASVITALTAVVAEHGRWGFWKCFDRLRLQGHGWNHKRVHRVYCALRLNLAAADEASCAAPSPSAARRAPGAESDLGDRFHGRCVIRPSTLSITHDHR
jgi:hypothetical protein